MTARSRSQARRAVAACAGLLLLACETYHQEDYLDYAPSRGLVLPAPPADQAQVVFLPTLHEAGELALYEDGRFLLPLRYYTCFVHRTTPGEHRYAVVSGENAAFASGELEGGATYVLHAYQTFAGHYSLRPVLPSERFTTLTIDEWLELCIRVEPNAQTALWRQQREPALEDRRREELGRWGTRPMDPSTRITPAFALHGDLEFGAR